MGAAISQPGNFFADSVAPIWTVPQAIAQGKSGNQIIGAAGLDHMKSDIAMSKSTIMGDAAQTALPTQQVTSQAELDRQAQSSARQSQIDLRQDRPGKSQTMLADNSAYPYRLV